MKKIVLKSGVFGYYNQKSPVKSGLDLRNWLKKELDYFGLKVDDPCCDNDGIPVDTDTRLTNPHISSVNLCFDLLNVITNAVTIDAICIPLADINIHTTLSIAGTDLVFVNETGVPVSLDLCPVVKLCETVTTLDSVTLAGDMLTITYTGENGVPQVQTVDLTTLSQTLAVDGNGGLTISDGNTVDLCPTVKACETQTTLDSVILSPSNILTIQYTGENGVAQTQTVDLSALAIDINIASVSFNPLTGDLTVTETDSTVHTVTIAPFVETVTTLTGVQATGKVIGTYTSEDATVTDIRETVTSLTANPNGTVTFVNENGVSVTSSLQVQTPITANDSALIDFTTSGVDNHTITATIVPSSTVGQVLTTSGVGVVTWETPLASSSFTLAGNAGTNQVITTGDTLAIQGAANSGIITTGVATDTLTIALREQKDTFTSLTSGTTVTASQTPIGATLDVYRNGLLKELTTEYTVSGTTITFSVPFGVSTGATGGETVILKYRY